MCYLMKRLNSKKYKREGYGINVKAIHYFAYEVSHLSLFSTSEHTRYCGQRRHILIWYLQEDGSDRQAGCIISWTVSKFS